MTTSIDPTSSIPAAAPQNSALANLSQNYTTFLRLLTAQLQNQDPMSPMDSAQFTQQLVAFSGVEQQISTNSKLDSLISASQSSGAGALLNYLGKTVEVKGQTMPLLNKQARFSYTLPALAGSAQVQITDDKGNIVRTTAVSTAAGKHVVDWDGTNDAGDDVAAGTYTVNIVAKGTDGEKMDATKIAYTTFGAVTGVQNTSSGSQLTVGNAQVGVDQVLSVN
jgi:flagellar basal-body rod modification protein FlgD